MKALIKEKAAKWGKLNTPNGRKVHEYLLKNREKWVEIDTKFLFDNQYNTIDGFRIHDTDIQVIENDARTGKDEFKNSFFVKHPNGIDPVKELDITNIDHKKEGFYSAYTVNGLFYRISRRENIEFVLVDGKPFLYGIGYKKPALNQNQKRILNKVIDIINKL